jgi:hypothetical protein
MAQTQSFIAQLKQPSSVIGQAIIAGGLAALGTGSLGWQTAIPVFISGLVSVLLPDNAQARTSIQHAVADVIEAEQALVSAQPGSKVVAASGVVQSPLADAASGDGRGAAPGVAPLVPRA